MPTVVPGRTLRRLLAVIAVLSLLTAACGSDDGTADGAGDTAAGAGDTSEAADSEEADDPDGESTGDGGGVATLLDADGDGRVVIGVATPGPRDDGAYYQALVEKVEQISADNGFDDAIVVDQISEADAATELENLAQQGVDVIAIGASQIADALPALAEQYPDIYWYCSCGAGFAESDLYSQSNDDGSEISYTAGVATGLLLQESGGDQVTFLGCCDQSFETESFEAMELGLQSVDPSFSATYVPTGDFNDVAAATEAFNGALAEGADAVYPFLGGAHEPVVQLANENGIITMSAGASDVCDRTDLDYQIAVRFDAGDYLDTLFAEMLDGSFPEGTTRVFHVGVDPEPGAIICDPTPEQEEALDEAYTAVANGDLAEEFGAIKADAYGF